MSVSEFFRLVVVVFLFACLVAWSLGHERAYLEEHHCQKIPGVVYEGRRCTSYRGVVHCHDIEEYPWQCDSGELHWSEEK